MTRNLVARTKIDALHVIGHRAADELELDYETAWRDVVELGRLGMRHDIRVTTRGSEYILVASPSALLSGLSQDKSTYRRRFLCCGFPLTLLSRVEMVEIQRRVQLHGDMLVTGPTAGTAFHAKW